MNYRAVAVAVAMLALSGTAAQASSLLINGGFEQGNANIDPFVTDGTGSGELTGWSVNSGSIDHIGNYWQPAEGTRSVDMSGNEAGSISQSFATQIGKQYVVSFSLAGNPDAKDTGVIKTLNSSVVGGSLLFSQDFKFDVTNTDKSNMGWINLAYSFIADSTSATLYFESLTQTAYGPALDNVAVSAVPLPAALPLFASGLAGLGLLGRRRKATIKA